MSETTAAARMRALPTTEADVFGEPTLGITLGWLGDGAEWAITFGHVVPADFVASVAAYLAFPPGQGFPVEAVGHRWAVREVDDLAPDAECAESWRWADVTAETALAFPVTVLDVRWPQLAEATR